MVITLDNGQTVTIYEDNNILPQLRDYIDKELYELILKKATGDFGETIEDLENEIAKLEDYNERLNDDNIDLENKNDKIIHQIKTIVDKSRNNKLSISEVENMLEQIWEGEN